MKTEEFYNILKLQGINFSCGVPCALLKNLFYLFMTDHEMPFILTVREEEALGVAAGALLAGKKPIALMQNSGLANSMNALASLLIPYKLPILILASWRGCIEDPAIHHRIIGSSITDLMNRIGISVQVVSKESPEEAILISIQEIEKKQIPTVMLLGRGVLT